MTLLKPRSGPSLASIPSKKCAICGEPLTWNRATGWNCTNRGCFAV